MKRLISVVLILCLVLGMSALAEPAAAIDAAALPQAGDVVHGF